MFDLGAVQAALARMDLDGWLLVDFRASNVLARRILDLEGRHVTSRRFAYAIPRRGAPRKLVHRIETGVLDHLPGEAVVYLRWQEFEAGLRGLVAGMKNVAMEYSPRNGIPYLGRVDAGTIELVRETGVNPVSSGDLIQEFEAAWDDAQWAMHLEAARHTDAAFGRVWSFLASRTAGGGEVSERAVQQVILDHFRETGLTTSSPPIVGVGPNSGNPHHETGDALIRSGDFVLVDLWGKLQRPRSVYSDLTRVAFLGNAAPERHSLVFEIVARARDAAIAAVERAMAAGKDLAGWEVDRAARDVITEAGYGEQFVHRTGHSIGQETHGNGANMDDLETHEVRRVWPRTCFSVEPGIYLPEFGVRSEVNVFVDAARQVYVTGGERQQQIVLVRVP